MTKKETRIIKDKKANKLLKDLLVRKIMELAEDDKEQVKETYSFNEVVEIITKSYVLGKIRG